MVEIDDAVEADLPAILAITNDAIVTTTANWSAVPETLESRSRWLAARRAAGYPVLVGRTDGHVVGFASYGEFRPREGYRFTVEHSVYVVPTCQRRGIGGALLAALIDRARAQNFHVMVGAIGAVNEASIRFHERAGFEEVGRLPEVGHKFGEWLDLVLMQKILRV